MGITHLGLGNGQRPERFQCAGDRSGVLGTLRHVAEKQCGQIVLMALAGKLSQALADLSEHAARRAAVPQRAQRPRGRIRHDC